MIAKWSIVPSTDTKLYQDSLNKEVGGPHFPSDILQSVIQVIT